MNRELHNTKQSMILFCDQGLVLQFCVLGEGKRLSMFIESMLCLL